MKLYSYGRTDITPFTISPADIDAAMQRAREDRAEVMRAALVKLRALFKRLAAAARPNRQRLPQSGAWA